MKSKNEINQNFFPFNLKRKGETMEGLFYAISDEASKYLDIDQLIQLSLTSTIPFFRGLNNLRYYRFIPSYDEEELWDIFFPGEDEEDDEDQKIEDNGDERRLLKEKLKAIKATVDYDAVDDDGDTLLLSLLHPFATDNTENVIALINRGANLILQSTNDILGGRGSTTLYLAIGRGNVEIVKLLIKKGVDVNVSTWALKTPLFKAIHNYSGDSQIMDLLIENGANINVKFNDDGYENALLQLAINVANIQAITILINAGIDSTTKNGLGETPLEMIKRKQSFCREQMEDINGYTNEQIDEYTSEQIDEYTNEKRRHLIKEMEINSKIIVLLEDYENEN